MTQWLDIPPRDDRDPGAVARAGGARDPETIYADVEAWVNDWLYVYSPVPPVWCPQWREHPPAVARLQALWEAWEVAQADNPPAMSSWWNYHHDTHLAALTAPRGPFAACQQQHRPTPAWRDHVVAQ